VDADGLDAPHPTLLTLCGTLTETAAMTLVGFLPCLNTNLKTRHCFVFAKGHPDVAC
jgi:hypothetical protein